MKVTSIKLTPNNSTMSPIILSFKSPIGTNPYLCKAIDGLATDEIVPDYYGYSTSGTDLFYNLINAKRDIVVLMGLNPSFASHETYSALRDTLYSMIVSSRTGLITIEFVHGDTTIAVLSGRIGKYETNLFEPKQEVLLTINCIKPNLRGIPTVELTDQPDSTGLLVVEDDISTAPHPFIMELAFTDSIDSLQIKQINPMFPADDQQWNTLDILPHGGFSPGDILSYSNEDYDIPNFYDGDKYLYYRRDGGATHLLDVVRPHSKWPIIFPGVNNYVFSHHDAFTLNYLRYWPSYWGV